MPGPIAGALIGAGSALLSNIWNASEARKNRRFQERMSNTAHQREVEDLKKANINPMFRGLGGASTPGGDRAQMEDVGAKGISSALAVRQAKSQIGLTDAQARLANTQASDISSTLGNRTELMSMQAKAASASADQLREMLPVLLDKAREEVRLTVASADKARADATLAKAAAAGAMNEEDFQQLIGQGGPWIKLFLEVVRGIRR